MSLPVPLDIRESTWRNACSPPGCTVRTITNSPNRANPFGGKVEVHPYNFDNHGRAG